MAAPGAHRGPDFAGAAAALGDDPAARQRLQQLEDQRKQLQAAKKRLAKDIANEQRKKARLMEKARGLSDADLAAIAGERALIAAKAAAKAKAKAAAKGKAMAKGKAKAKAAPAAPAAAPPVGGDEDDEEAAAEEEDRGADAAGVGAGFVEEAVAPEDCCSKSVSMRLRSSFISCRSSHITATV